MSSSVLFAVLLIGFFFFVVAIRINKENSSSAACPFFGIIGIAAILISGLMLLGAWIKSTGKKEMIDEKFYVMQTVKKPDGGEMQIIVMEDGSMLNMNLQFGRSFKGGELVRRYVLREKSSENVNWTEDPPKYELMKKAEREDFK